VIDPEGAEKFLRNAQRMEEAASMREYIQAYARAVWYAGPFLLTVLSLSVLLAGIWLCGVLSDA